MSKYVAIKIGGLVTVHLPHTTGDYLTLCGLDGDDPDSAVAQQMVDAPQGDRVDCVECWNIFCVCKRFTARDFHQEIRDEYG